MIKQTYLKKFNKLLWVIAAAIVLYCIGIAVYVRYNDPDKYLSSNPDEAMPQLYAALTNKLESNPSKDFLNAVSQAYADQIITEQEYIRLTLNHELTMSNDLYLEFKPTKQQFHKTWLNHQNVKP
ncbi:hypothetical protein H5201_09570 [Pseudoalteromonas sp. SG43-6]|uniref:hypothetical protein n=1 Tax=Pseudoalteromonas sp. SG43-6 TaxID=2760967 RepID=UPI001603E273|nr:hypothetical protein [Pseudoalteromonas sp. SG43-6]MBB1434556.1 hypothetical protein [Pseudoalteromonas sp. SG43-6]